MYIMQSFEWLRFLTFRAICHWRTGPKCRVASLKRNICPLYVHLHFLLPIPGILWTLLLVLSVKQLFSEEFRKVLLKDDLYCAGFEVLGKHCIAFIEFSELPNPKPIEFSELNRLIFGFSELIRPMLIEFSEFSPILMEFSTLRSRTLEFSELSSNGFSGLWSAVPIWLVIAAEDCWVWLLAFFAWSFLNLTWLKQTMHYRLIFLHQIKLKKNDV